MLDLCTEDQVAKQLRVSLASVRRWRLEKRGPLFIKVGVLVRYRPEDIENWLKALPTGGSTASVANLMETRNAGLLQNP